MSKKHRSQFLKEIKEKFPETRDGINQQEGLLSFEVDAFISFVQEKIDAQQRSDVKQCFDLLNDYYSHGNSPLHELIRNAVCEDLIFENTRKHSRSWALELLPGPVHAERERWLRFLKGTA